MSDPKHDIPTKLLWVDLEMTGLLPHKDVILEIAATVTDFDFNELGMFDAVITHPQATLDGMSEWAATHHAASGLTARIGTHGRPEQDVVGGFAAFITQHFGNEPAILAGNSIHNDRIFIKQWWPSVDALLHYRMLDVSSFKILMQAKYGVMFDKKEAHRAGDDIAESIAELKYYLQWFTDKI